MSFSPPLTIYASQLAAGTPYIVDARYTSQSNSARLLKFLFCSFGLPIHGAHDRRLRTRTQLSAPRTAPGTASAGVERRGAVQYPVCHALPPREAHGGSEGCRHQGSGGDGLGASGAKQLRHHAGTTGKSAQHFVLAQTAAEGLKSARTMKIALDFFTAQSCLIDHQNGGRRWRRSGAG